MDNQTERCLKGEGGRGLGCCKTRGHNGRCKVRPDAAELFATGVPSPRVATRGLRATATRGLRATAPHGPRAHSGLGRSLGDLAELAERIEAETNGLMADCRAALAAVQAAAEAVNARNRALLVALVKSRRQVQGLSAGAGAADAKAADADGEDAAP